MFLKNIPSCLYLFVKRKSPTIQLQDMSAKGSLVPFHQHPPPLYTPGL